MAPSSPSLPNLASLSLSTPLEKFFQPWEANHGFERHQNKTPIEEFERLVEHMKWIEGSKGYRKRYKEFIDAAPAIVPPNREDHVSECKGPTVVPPPPNPPGDGTHRLNHFATFISKGFTPDPTAPLASEFTRLAKSQGWRPNSKRYRKERALCFATEFEAHYGNKSERLEGWQSLCQEVDIDPIPLSITKCKKELKALSINIVDLIDCRRTGQYPVLRHKSKRALRAYSKSTGKIFSLRKVKENGFLTVLLIDMY
ncbi:MAG: hypothetical protein M1840_008331 [Geoglossum simile]|nr:MAG: hypothetical protein M1840_008331 [Geoglossum simile]